jgi:hypothetical protein
MTSTTKPSLVRSLTSPPSTSSTPSTSLLQQQQEGMTWDKFVVATQKILFSGIRARDLGVTIAVLVIYAAAAAYTLQANLKKS